MEELSRLPIGKENPYAEAVQQVEDVTGLRRFFRREMFRIQAASMCLRVPVFETLEMTSDLADAAIAASYRMAVEQVVSAQPPARSYQPRQQLMVVALGRLGMREFDLASDADLLFILPDEDHDELLFWTRVAERIIDLITAYTGAGLMFAVDTRLRPNGSAGALLQSEQSYKEYFAKHAEAWEGIAYMKSRAVAGDTERATKFLTALQQVDWRRYGQSGRSKKDLRQMRVRLEKEQGIGHPLKAGPGGFYDIDFSLLYLRLKAAGIFYKVLNTPERDRHHRSDGAPGARRCRVSARCGDVLSRAGSRLARVLRSRGSEPAEFGNATRSPHRTGAPLDARALEPAAAQS